MRKIYALASALLVSAFGFAQTDVTFQVNMMNQTVSPAGVHIAGDFDANGSSGTAWDPAAYEMTDSNNDGIYDVTIPGLQNGRYRFKFINDSTWAGVESVPAGAQVGGDDNRWMYVTGGSAVTLDPICFGEMVDCGKVGVVFQVNMSTQTVSNFGVHVVGNFQTPNWTPDATRMFNPDGSPIYKHIHAATAGDSYEFKYINGDSWGDDEIMAGTSCEQNGNRFINNIQADTTFTPLCFGSCDECATSDVTFTVDMSNEASVDPAGVLIAGTFNGWSDNDVMTDNGDGTWSITLPLQAQSHSYKFKNGPNGWEGGFTGDRTINVTSNDTSVTYCFNTLDVTCPTWPDSSMITFRVDVTDVASQVSTDADSGGVYVMGGFTTPTWQDGALQLTQEGTSNIYSGTFKVGGNTNVLFKYVLNKPNTSLAVEESADFSAIGGCGVDNGGFTDNRNLTRSANDTTTCFAFDVCDACGSTGFNNLTDGGFDIAVYPNPFSNNAMVAFGEEGDYTIIVSDLTGKVVRTARVQGGDRYELNASDLNNGLYILQATDADMNVSTVKLIVQ